MPIRNCKFYHNFIMLSLFSNLSLCCCLSCSVSLLYPCSLLLYLCSAVSLLCCIFALLYLCSAESLLCCSAATTFISRSSSAIALSQDSGSLLLLLLRRCVYAITAVCCSMLQYTHSSLSLPLSPLSHSAASAAPT